MRAPRSQGAVGALGSGATETERGSRSVGTLVWALRLRDWAAASAPLRFMYGRNCLSVMPGRRSGMGPSGSVNSLAPQSLDKTAVVWLVRETSAAEVAIESSTEV